MLKRSLQSIARQDLAAWSNRILKVNDHRIGASGQCLGKALRAICQHEKKERTVFDLGWHAVFRKELRLTGSICADSAGRANTEMIDRS
jgi:hypothetical protein